MKEAYVTQKFINRDGVEKERWTKIGVAFESANGFITVRLDALPMGGKIVLKEAEVRQASQKDAAPATDEDSIPF